MSSLAHFFCMADANRRDNEVIEEDITFGEVRELVRELGLLYGQLREKRDAELEL